MQFDHAELGLLAIIVFDGHGAESGGRLHDDRDALGVGVPRHFHRYEERGQGAVLPRLALDADDGTDIEIDIRVVIMMVIVMVMVMVMVMMMITSNHKRLPSSITL